MRQKPGPDPTYGPRKLISTRLDISVYEKFSQAAAEQGMARGELATLLIKDYLEVSQTNAKPELIPDQEELPLVN